MPVSELHAQVTPAMSIDESVNRDYYTIYLSSSAFSRSYWPAIGVIRLSVRLSVCLSVSLSVTLNIVVLSGGVEG